MVKYRTSKILQITKCLPGRTDNSVKNRFHAVERARLRHDRMVTPEVYPIYFLKKRKLQQDPDDTQAFQYLRALGRMGYMAGPGLAALGAGGPMSMSELNGMSAAAMSASIAMSDTPSMNPLLSHHMQQQQYPSEPNSARRPIDA